MLDDIVRKAEAFRRDAHSLLQQHEASPSRVVELRGTYERASRLSIRQDDLMKQALRCIEQGLYRAAHVMAWAAFMDFFEEKLAEDGLRRLRTERANWKAKTVEELREEVAEFQIIEAGKDVGLCTKNLVKALHGLLNKRNECAHPSDFYPELNDTLGYVSELLARIQYLQPRTVTPVTATAQKAASRPRSGP